MTDYLAKPTSAPRGGVLVLPAWWGLNEFFKNLCRKLADEGYTVLAVDLYDGKIAKTIPEAEELRDSAKRDVTSKKILAGLNQLQIETSKKPIAVMGFSLGAFWSLWLVEEKPKAIAASVLFYGTHGGDYAKTRAAFLGHFAETDEYESNSDVKKLEKTLRAAGKDATFFTYPNTSHWFFESDRPEFNAQAANLAWKRTVEFLKTNLG